MVSPRCENHQNEAQVKIAQQLLLSVYKQPLDVKAHPKTILKQLAQIIFPLCFLSAPHRTWYEKVCTGFFLKLQTIVSIKSITVASLYKTKKSSQESLLRSWNQRMFGLWHLRFQKNQYSADIFLVHFQSYLSYRASCTVISNLMLTWATNHQSDRRCTV